MRNRHLQRAGLLFGAVLAAILFFAGGAALRLLMGPISLGPFAGAIEDSINRSLTGLVVRFDQAVLEWSRSDGQINLIVSGTVVFDTTGRIVAQAPRADLDFELSSLLAGDFALKRFALLNVQLTAVRDQQGALKLGFGQAESDVDLFEMIRNTLDSDNADSGTLETFSIEDARLAFRDESTGLFVVSPDANFSVARSNENFAASLEAVVELSGVPAQLFARASFDDSGVPIEGSLNVSGLDLAALASNSERFNALAPYALTTNIAADYQLEPDGSLSEASFVLGATGSISPVEISRVIEVDALDIRGRIEGSGDRILIESARLEGPSLSAAAAGDLGFNWEDLGLVSLAADLQFEDLHVDMPDLFAAPIDLGLVNVEATYEQANRRVEWQRVVLDSGALQADFAGTTEFPADTTPAISFTGSIERLEATELLGYWPLTVADGARSWLAENISEGFIGPIGVVLEIEAGMLSQGMLPDEAVAIVTPFDGITARYMTGLTPLTEIVADAVLSGNTFNLRVSEARVGPLVVTGGDFTIPNLHSPRPPGDINASVSGSAADILALIDMEPLGYPTRFNVEPSSVSGQADVVLDFTLPMRRDLAVDDVRIEITANANGLGLPLSETRTLTDARIEFFVDNDHLTAEGTGNVNDVPMLITWEENFDSRFAYSTQVRVRGTLDEAGRESLRLVVPEWMSGPIPVSGTFLGRQFNFERAEIRADLTPVGVDIDLINFVKQPGQIASGSGIVEFLDDGGIDVSELRIDGSEIEVLGEFSLDRTGRLFTASLSTVRRGSDTDFGLQLSAPEGQAPSWRIAGRNLDARRIFSDENEIEQEEPNQETEQVIAPVHVDLEVETVLVREDLALHDVTYRFVMEENERLADFYLDGTGPGDGTIIGRFSEEGDTRSVTITSDDAGGFVEAFTGFPSLRGGEISVDANFRPDSAGEASESDADYSGTISISNFAVVDQPFMARLFSIGSLDGPLRLLQNEGIPFSEFEAPYMARGGRVNINGGHASGNAMGISFDGMVDRDNDTININGSMVPIFGLNSMLGALPLVGDLLVSKEGEGIIGLTYQARGELDEPDVVVNPLSMLTPGFLRRIFEFGGPPEQFGTADVSAAQSASEAASSTVPSQTE